jgi:hypothetical protein
MPKAAVDQDNSFPFRKDEIGSSGQISTVEAKAKAKCVCEPPYYKLWFGILAPDARHHPASSFLINDVHGVTRISWETVSQHGLASVTEGRLPWT